MADDPAFRASRASLGRCRSTSFAVACVLLTIAAACGRDVAGAADVPATNAPTASGGDVVPSMAAKPACAPANDGLTLPAGFCATIFADEASGARHVAVAPNGDVFVAVAGAGGAGGILALRDTNRDGVADVRARFGGGGGTGIAVAPGWVYADEGGRIARYPVASGQLRASGDPQVIVDGLPTGGHAARNIVLDGRGNLFVNVGSRTNSCQQADRQSGSPGVDPCTELETRAGIWRFDANRAGQHFASAARYATGLRNGMGLTLAPDGTLWATQHGRDQFLQNWPRLYDAAQSAEEPAEELMQLQQGDDFGWPYCYYDNTRRALVLAPEYGGDGGKAVGRCAQKKAPVAAFPGHWAPMAAAFYRGSAFPARYRGGVFITFHGSWNRAPEPQAGYRVVFQPLSGARASGAYETFANGFAGDAAATASGSAAHRPVGIAESPDGGLYVTDDAHGRIWKLVYTGAR